MESGIQKEYNAGNRAGNESEVSGSQALLLRLPLPSGARRVGTARWPWLTAVYVAPS